MKPDHIHDTMTFTIHITKADDLALDSSPRSRRDLLVRSRPTEPTPKWTLLASLCRCLCTLLVTLPVDPVDRFESLVEQWLDVSLPRPADLRIFVS
jgi:hypothetical protein